MSTVRAKQFWGSFGTGWRQSLMSDSVALAAMLDVDSLSFGAACLHHKSPCMLCNK